MKAKILTLIICFTSLFAFAENGNDSNHSYKFSTKRTIDANFEVSDSSNISLIGKYSDYKISSWEENYVSFHVEIIAKANKEEYAEEMLYAIDVDFNNDGDPTNDFNNMDAIDGSLSFDITVIATQSADVVTP